MRIGLLIAGLAAVLVLGIALTQGWLGSAYDRLTEAALDEDARLALDLRCGEKTGTEHDECRATLKKLFLSGSLDPDTTLRTWCDSVKQARWGGSRPPPPEVCVQRFGGWRES